MKVQTAAWDARGNNFDALRLGLAVLVIYSHAFPLGTGSEAAEPLLRATHGEATGGALAVDSFFILSGFLITLSASRSRSVWSFLKKRVARIYPAFAVAALVSLLLVLPASGGVRVGGVCAALLQTLRLREFDYAGAFAGNPYPGVVNGSLWSVQYEFWCYVGVAGLLAAGLLGRRALVTALFAAAWMVSVLFRAHGWVLGGKALGVLLGPPQLWARLLPLYLAGMVFALWRRHIPLRGELAAVCLVVLGVACGMPLQWHGVALGWTALFPLAGTYLLFYAAFAPGLRLHGFGRFGDFSYGTYLYAFPIEQMLVRRLGPMAPARLFLLAAPLAVLAGVASWYAVERPFLRPARRHTAQQATVASAET